MISRVGRAAVLVVAFAHLGALKQCAPTLDIPRPPTFNPPPPPQAELSTINLEVTVPVSPVQDAIHRAVPWVVAEDSGGSCDEFGIYRTGPRDIGDPPSVTAAGPNVTMKLPLAYRGGRRCFPVASCGYNEPARRVDVVTTIATQWNPNWKLDVTPTTGFDFLDQCTVTFLGINVTDKVRQAARPHADAVNDRVRSLLGQRADFAAQAQQLWSQLNAPIDLGQGAWLNVNPAQVRVSALNGQGSRISLSMGLSARPTVILSNAPPAPTPVALPLLASGGQADRFHVVLDTTAPYAATAERVDKALIGRVVDLPMGKQVRIVDTELFGAGNLVIVAVTVQGAAKGTVYLAGTPLFLGVAPNGDHEVIVVENFDFTLETKNVLLKTANWLAHRKFVDEIKSHLRFPVSRQLSQLRSQLNAALNRQVGPGTMSGGVEALRVIGVYTYPDRLQVRGVADGTARITITP